MITLEKMGGKKKRKNRRKQGKMAGVRESGENKSTFYIQKRMYVLICYKLISLSK